MYSSLRKAVIELTHSNLLDRLNAATELLEFLDINRALLEDIPPEDRARFHRALAQIYEPDPLARRKRLRAEAQERNAAVIEKADAVLTQTGIRELRRKPVFTTPNFRTPEATPEEAAEIDAQHCYVCKQDYEQVHHFYDQLCPACAELNFRKRSELANLQGRVALLTGGRVKIGYQAGIKLLRSGCELIVTTRFPRDAAERYANESGFAEWGHRLKIYGLDLRHTPSVEAFCAEMLATQPRLDFIINNACQTVRRPPDFYTHMMAGETRALEASTASARDLVRTGTRIHSSAETSQLKLLPEEFLDQNHLFPKGLLDQDMQQLDLRGRNSWRLLLDEVSSVELIEVQLINAIAPFVFNARLKPLMMRTPERNKHIVNVSAVEGQFYRRWKTTRHPHTNMAKASLNMMTRTSAADYQADGIYMNSVDTGWVTDEDPASIAARKTVEQRFHPPLDIVDGAARIVDPIIHGFNSGEHVWGQFLKDYKPVAW